MALLEVKNLHTSYGAIKAIRGISFSVEEGEIVTLIGANGAGKTTTLNSIVGLVRPSAGEIWFNGENVTNLDPADKVKRGMVLAPEGRQVFPDLSVETNLKLGAYTSPKNKVLRVLNKPIPCFRFCQNVEHSWQEPFQGRTADAGSCQGLNDFPETVMLDEPSLGLAPIIVANIFDLIKKINSMGTTILLVEQNARMALSISHRGYVIETGRIV